MTPMVLHTVLSYPAHAGVSGTPRLLGSIIDVSGILDRPPSRTTTTEYDFVFSRRFAPEVLQVTSRPLQSEGAGNAGCTLHPRSRAQRGSRLRARAYRAAEAIRHSLRNGFTAYIELSPVNGSFATVALCGLMQALDASTAASGQHDFAVRFSTVRYRHLPRPPQPVPRS